MNLKNMSLLLLFLVILFMPLATAQIALESFVAEPDVVSPGGETSLQFTIANAGSKDVENVVVSLDLSKVPFAIVGSSNEKVIAKIPDHHDEALSFLVKSLPHAEPGFYKIPVIITSQNLSKVSFINIEVSAPAQIDLLIDNSEIVTINDKGKVTLKFVNNGLNPIKFLKATLLESPYYNLLSPSPVYIGDVDVGDFETEEFVLIAKTEDPILILDLEYRDGQNRLITQAKMVTLPVYNSEEAQKLGLIQNQSFASIIIVVALIFLIGFFWYRRRKKKHEN